MMDLTLEYNGKLKECEEILATIPLSLMKQKAGSVQHLLASNSALIEGSTNIYGIYKVLD